MFSVRRLDGRYNNNYYDKASATAAFVLADRSKVTAQTVEQSPGPPARTDHSASESSESEPSPACLSEAQPVRLPILGARPPGRADVSAGLTQSSRARRALLLQTQKIYWGIVV